MRARLLSRKTQGKSNPWCSCLPFILKIGDGSAENSGPIYREGRLAFCLQVPAALGGTVRGHPTVGTQVPPL